MSIQRIGAPASRFGALVTAQVNYQSEDKIITTVTRRTASGKQEQEEKTQEVPFAAHFTLKATESEDKAYANIAGLTGNDSPDNEIHLKLSLTPEGHLKLDSEYTREWTQTYWTEEPYEVPDRYIREGDSVAPYTRATESYWEYKTEYRNVQKTDNRSERVQKTLVADSQEKFNELYRFLNAVKNQSQALGDLFKDVQTRGTAFVAGAKAAIVDAWQVKEAALRHSFEARLAALKEAQAQEIGQDNAP